MPLPGNDCEVCPFAWIPDVLAANAQRVLTAVANWLTDTSHLGGNIWLVTVVETYGSSPRPVGSLMAFRIAPADMGGQVDLVGSVSGGCLEQDLIDGLRQEDRALPQLRAYGKSAEEQNRYQLPCGGSLTVLVEPVQRNDVSIDHFSLLASKLKQRKSIFRYVDLHTGQRSIINANPTGRSGWLNPIDVLSITENCMTQAINPQWRLLVLGAGEVAVYLAAFASVADFDVTVCEPRREYADGWHESAPLLRRLPDELIAEAFNDEFVAIVGVSHDPRVDDMGLMCALETSAFFVGCMGSKKTSTARRKRLQELGVVDDQMRKLHAPVGVDIFSKTPAEIAISIVAQLIAERKRYLVSLSAPAVDEVLGHSCTSQNYIVPCKA